MPPSRTSVPVYLSFLAIAGCGPQALQTLRGDDPEGNRVEVRILQTGFEFPSYSCLTYADADEADVWVSIKSPRARRRLETYALSRDTDACIAYLTRQGSERNLCMMRPVQPGEFSNEDRDIVVGITDFCALLEDA